MIFRGSKQPVHASGLARQAITRVRWRERLIGTAALFLPVPSSSSSPYAWEDGSTILLYHRVVDDSGTISDPFAVKRERFASQVAWLSRTYTVVTARELAQHIRENKPVAGMAAITFDDGYDCTYRYAWPILRTHGIPATVFIDTGRLDGASPALSRDQIREMAAGGIEIGSHTVSHSDLQKLSETGLLDELAQSRRELSEIIEQPVTGFAYPFGLYDDRVVRFVCQAGYAYACTCRQHCNNHSGDDPYRLNRVEINLTDGQERFEKKVKGRYANVYGTWYRINPATRSWLVG